MKTAALVFVVFSTYFVYSVSSKCCSMPSLISYSTKPGYECSDVKGGANTRTSRAQCVVPACANGKLPHNGRCTTGKCVPFSCNCTGECIPPDDEATVENFKKLNEEVLQSVTLMLGSEL